VLLAVVGLVVLVAPVMFLAAMFAAIMGGRLPETGKGVAVIRVEGVITAGRAGGLLGAGMVGAESIANQIERALEDTRVKALLVRINSPGGSAAGAEEIHRQLMKAREQKPVVASMGDVAASGGYYIASAVEEIFCNASTVTASIGVIDPHLDLSALMKKIGVNYDPLTSGEFKDMGSFARPYSLREKELMKGMIEDVYEQFVEAVAEGRRMPKEKVRKIADGRILTGRQALQAGLVDKIGGFQQALEAAARKAGIVGRPRRIEYGPRGLFGVLLGRDDYATALEAFARRLLLRSEARRFSETMLR